MKHDDGRHGCKREEDKKREAAMKLQCPNPKAQTLMLKLLQNCSPNLQHNNTMATNIYPNEKERDPYIVNWEGGRLLTTNMG
jgi:hypothetical protein